MTDAKNRILVTAASKYQATLEIAQAIGDALAERGFDVTIYPIEDVTAVDGYDAVVAGSAVYAGHWMKPAREFVERYAAELAARPVWLFSSGPIGDPPKPQEDPVDASELVEQSGAREHRVFAGKLDRSRLSFGEKAIVLALRAPEGDFRDWDEVRSWAMSIADSLRGGAGS
jgi:menaquinone-dependent protoporphyrinogen oxidase